MQKFVEELMARPGVVDEEDFTALSLCGWGINL
jgi:hypothetical protein